MPDGAASRRYDSLNDLTTLILGVGEGLNDHNLPVTSGLSRGDWSPDRRLKPQDTSVDVRADGFFESCGMEAEGARRAFEFHYAVTADEIEAIGPTGVGFFDSIAELIDECGDLDAEFADAAFGDSGPFFKSLGVDKNHVVADVAGHLPDVAGMGFADIDDVELYPVLVLFVEFVERGNLPAKGRSSIAAEDQDDGILVAEGRELHVGGAVERFEGEVGGGVAGLKMAGAGVHPQSFERKDHEGDG